VNIDGNAKMLRIYLGETDKWQGQSLYDAIVEMLKKNGIAGATVTRGIEGFGRKSRIHTASILRLSQDLPVIIEAVDNEDRIRKILPDISDMVTGGLITLEDVEIVKYCSDTSEDSK